MCQNHQLVNPLDLKTNRHHFLYTKNLKQKYNIKTKIKCTVLTVENKFKN